MSGRQRAILKALDFDFFELLDSVTIARSRKHIETFYDTKLTSESFPSGVSQLSFHPNYTDATDVMGLNDIFGQLSVLKLAFTPLSATSCPAGCKKYEEMYDTQVVGGRGKLRRLIASAAFRR
jgi:hypothetical protein